MPDVQVLADAASVARVAAETVAEVLSNAAERRGRCSIALSGGSTPRDLYRRLGSIEYVERVPWDALHVFWGDERCVPPVDPDSDYLMAKEAMLDHVPVPAGRIHRIRGEDPPERAAEEYERLLRRSFGEAEGPPPLEDGARFDLVLLGMGEDGHTASLFPGTGAVLETARWVIHVRAQASPRNRVSLTAPVLSAAARKLFLVTGMAKAPTLARVLEGPRDLDAAPAQAIEGAEWLVDAAAASMLSA